MSPRVSARLLATQPDQRLTLLVANGHERAFEAIVNRYRRQLLAYCRRIGLSDARAEDVLQQSFLKAWLALREGADVRELRPWLYRIVHNTALNAIRSAPALALLGDEGTGPVQPAVVREDLQAARDALADLAALPEMQREAILMSAIHGRSHDEVAAALGISSGAVRGLLYRARSALRSAAAAVLPAPLVAWAAGGAARFAPTAAGLAQLQAASGGDAGALLLKGAAVAVVAAVAAGAALVPFHASKSHEGDAAAATGTSHQPASSGGSSAASTGGSPHLAGKAPGASPGGGGRGPSRLSASVPGAPGGYGQPPAGGSRGGGSRGTGEAGSGAAERTITPTYAPPAGRWAGSGSVAESVPVAPSGGGSGTGTGETAPPPTGGGSGSPPPTGGGQEKEPGDGGSTTEPPKTGGGEKEALEQKAREEEAARKEREEEAARELKEAEEEAKLAKEGIDR